MGPALCGLLQLERAILKGVNVFRLNFSHSDHKVHQQSIRDIRQVSRKVGKSVAILVDLKGPEIRTGNRSYEIKEGEFIALAAGDIKQSTAIPDPVDKAKKKKRSRRSPLIIRSY